MTAMTSMYAAAMPVAASATPTRPAGRAYTRPRGGPPRRGEHGSACDAELGAQNACLGRQHQQQHDADQGARHTGNGQHFADPALGALLPRLWRRRWRGNVWRRRRGILRGILRPSTAPRARTAGGTTPACGGRLLRRNGLGRRRLLRQKAVERGQIRGHAGQLPRDRGEVRGQPRNDGTMRRFLHGGSSSAQAKADE